MLREPQAMGAPSTPGSTPTTTASPAPALPDEMLLQVLLYLPHTVRTLLPLCGVNQTWRRVATRDALWATACKQEYGRLLLERLGVQHEIFAFYLQHTRACRHAYRPVLQRPPGREEVCCVAPPESFFAPYTWIMELREPRQGNLVWSGAMDLANAEARGRLFTSSGNSIVGDGLRLGIDVKPRLPPPPASFDGGAAVLPRHRNNSSKTTVAVASGAGAVAECHGNEQAKTKRNNRPEEEEEEDNCPAPCKQGKDQDAAAVPVPEEADDEEAALLFTLSLYDRQTQRSACFVSSRLVTDRPPRWQGRFWDGPFSGPEGQPTAWVVLDPTHTLQVLPVVDMADWGDKTFLLRVRVDLRVCQCGGDEDVGNGGGGGGRYAMNDNTGAAVQGACHCSPFDGLGMIHEEGTWIVLHDLLANKLQWF